MSGLTAWPRVKLGDVLIRSAETIEPIVDQEYREITVRLWGKGVVERGRLLGASVGGRRFVARTGQFIASRIDARNGAMGLVPANLDGALVSNDFPLFEVRADRLLPGYLGWMCRTTTFVDMCARASEGTTNRVRLKEDDFLRLEIALPLLPEQQRIVARIEVMAQELAGAQTIRASSDLATDALLTATVSAYFAGDSLWRPLRDAVLPTRDAVRSGPFGSQLLHEEFTTAGVAAIGTRDVQTDRFDLTSGWFVTPEKFETFKRYKVYPGDILCTIVGASIGRFCVVPLEVPDAFTTKHIQALTLNPAVANSRFCSLMLNFHRRSRASLFSQVEGSAQPSLNAAKVLATQVPLPPLAEQRRVVAEVDALQAELLALNQAQAHSRTELDALLPAILDRAFAGAL